MRTIAEIDAEIAAFRAERDSTMERIEELKAERVATAKARQKGCSHLFTERRSVLAFPPGWKRPNDDPSDYTFRPWVCTLCGLTILQAMVWDPRANDLIPLDSNAAFFGSMVERL
jgi:hypothetical protein